MYKKILIAVDNSLHSNHCIDLGIDISKKFNSHLVGCHVYDASLHQRRFRDMEKGLPPQYQDENVLQRQRELHTSLINLGLKLISESYLDVFVKKCSDAAVSHERRLLEGKNYHEIIKEVQRERYDLVIIGAAGLASVTESLIGSVCERVVRRINTDVLVVKNNCLDGKIVVAVDGSAQSSAGVKSAINFAKLFNLKLSAVSVFDPHYHRVAFGSIAKVLSKEAGQIFRFREQETLHEEIIDKGLAKIYQNHLDKANLTARDAGVEIDTVLMDGKPYDQILKYLRGEEKPSLLILGRTGIHNTNGLDIGSTSENLLRLSPCSVLLTGGNVEAKLGTTETRTEYASLPEDKKESPMRDNREVTVISDKTISWTKEAQIQTERIPSFIRGVVRVRIEEYARDNGYSEITPEIVNEARAKITGDSLLHSAVKP